MNQDPSLPSWPEHAPDEAAAAMIPTTAEDYTSLLDFNFDLAEFDGGNAGERQNQNMVTTAPPLVSTTGMQDISGLTSMEHINTSQPLQKQQHFPASVTMAGSEPVTPMEIQGSNSMQLQQQHFYMKQQQQQQQQQHSQNAYGSNYGQRQSFVPPTPDSADMHCGSHNYNLRLETGHQRGYEPFTRGLEDQVSSSTYLYLQRFFQAILSMEPTANILFRAHLLPSCHQL